MFYILDSNQNQHTLTCQLKNARNISITVIVTPFGISNVIHWSLDNLLLSQLLITQVIFWEKFTFAFQLELEFNSPVNFNSLRSCQASQLTFFCGQAEPSKWITSNCAHCFTSNLELSFLNLRKGRINVEMIYYHSS